MPRITGIVIAAILAGPAMAADLSISPPPAPLAYNWTGLYFGINGGGAWGQQDPIF
jgi:outer membrane immunogenic protein